jgi:hypothetical protein
VVRVGVQDGLSLCSLQTGPEVNVEFARLTAPISDDARSRDHTIWRWFPFSGRGSWFDCRWERGTPLIHTARLESVYIPNLYLKKRYGVAHRIAQGSKQ